MRIIQILIMMGLCLISSQLRAEDIPSLASDFTFEGNPIGPECFFPIVSSKSPYEPVFLKGNACQENQQPYDPVNLKKGFIGYTVEGAPRMMKAPYIFYKYLGKTTEKMPFGHIKMPGYDLVEIQWSDGSTESASGIFIVEKKDETLQLIMVVDKGDRCFGSVQDGQLKDNMLSYSKEVTPQGLVDLLVKPHETKRYASVFEDCAVCCIGSLTFKDGNIEGMKVTTTLEDIAKKLLQEDPSSPQYCFDGLYIFLLAMNPDKTSFNIDEIKQFVDIVQEQCFPQKI